MTKVTVYKQDGSKSGDIDLKDEIFGIAPNNAVITDAVLMQRASMRQGTHKTKNRSEVSGGGKKPWRQKGTGRARQGSIRAPQWRGGGTVFGPGPRDYSYRINRKQYQLALKSVWSQLVADDKLVVVDEFKFDQPKTKDFAKSLASLKVDTKALVILDEDSENTQKSARNIDRVNVLTAKGINVLDLVNTDKVVIAKSAIEQVQEVLS